MVMVFLASGVGLFLVLGAWVAYGAWQASAIHFVATPDLPVAAPRSAGSPSGLAGGGDLDEVMEGGGNLPMSSVEVLAFHQAVREELSLAAEVCGDARRVTVVCNADVCVAGARAWAPRDEWLSYVRRPLRVVDRIVGQDACDAVRQEVGARWRLVDSAPLTCVYRERVPGGSDTWSQNDVSTVCASFGAR